MEGWDLQAVVRGCSSTADELGFSNFLNSPLDLDEILSFFDEEKDGFDYNKSVSPQSNQSSSTSLMSVLTFCGDEVIKQEDKAQKQLSLSESSHAPSPLSVIKSKRSSKKNQQKRVVKHVAGDAASSDKWAWRKYGQKPIKGSPFPRSYYRCSSLKGCMARKQVERSKDDPSVFIITYTADHCHPHPTRRNSLAGTTRTKDPNSAKQALDPNQSLVKDETSHSDTIPNPNPMDHIVQHVITSIKTELLDEEDEEMGVPNMVFSEDLFASLEDFEGMLFDQFMATPPSQVN